MKNKKLNSNEYKYAKFIYDNYDYQYSDEMNDKLKEKLLVDYVERYYRFDYADEEEEQAKMNEIKDEFYFVCDYINQLYETINYYDDMLELSANQTLFEIEVPSEILKVKEKEVEMIYQDMVETYLSEFEEETGVTAYLLR